MHNYRIQNTFIMKNKPATTKAKNIKSRVIAFSACSIFLSSCSLQSNVKNIAVDNSDAETQVYKHGDTVFYIGAISDEANKQLVSYIDKNTKTLKISSRGGEIMLGMDLGDIIFANSLNVEVDEFCFSSCANYVFPAGKTKILNKNSMIGWHGGALQKMVFDDSETELAYKSYIEPAQKREAEYFRKIGVMQLSTIYGQRDEFKHFEKCAGWNYSKKAMAYFGMKDVILPHDGWQPNTNFNGKCIFSIDDIKH